ncbi:hypothetical protein [Trabulsiella odontotermitis]|nr:hypothetical protein [Trabulsiella odontotermitis]
MTIDVLVWMLMVLAVMWLICGTATLVAGGFIWPFREGKDD